jgi:hypothetical protein
VSAILFVFDKSGSMTWGLDGNDQTPPGQRRIDYAKAAMRAQLSRLADNIPAGLIFFPYYSSCDTSVVIPIAPNQRSSIQQTIEQLDIPWSPHSSGGSGGTPLAGAIDLAGNTVKSYGDPVRIVVLTDGEETCGGDPIAAARRWREQGVNLEMHIIGFAVEAETRNQLSSIAAAAGGHYYDARDSAQLETALGQALHKREWKSDPAMVKVTGSWISNKKDYEASQGATSAHTSIKLGSFFAFAQFEVGEELAKQVGKYESEVHLRKDIGGEWRNVANLAEAWVTDLPGLHCWVRRPCAAPRLYGGSYRVVHFVNVGDFIDSGSVEFSIPGPAIEIGRVWIKHNRTVSGHKGMEFHVRFSVRDYRGERGRVCVFIYTQDGELVKNDGDKRYITPSGHLTVQAEFAPKGTKAKYKDFTLFLPYNQFYKGSHSYYGIVEIQDGDGKSWAQARSDGFEVKRQS